MRRPGAVLAAALAAAATFAAPAGAARLVSLGPTFSTPVHATSVPGDLDRVFVVERHGRVHVVRDGVKTLWADLDAGDRIDSRGPEEGLLSLAFPRDHATTGLYYAFFTERLPDPGTTGSDLVVEERRAGVAAPVRELVRIPHRQADNHNGGQLQLGPDGALWAATGDGGHGAAGNAQDEGSRLGKLLRIDLATGAVTQRGVGLRNPWRFSFDRGTGDLWLGDVGENSREEIDHVPATTLAGGGLLNFGWNVVEGSLGTPPASPGTYVGPRFEHEHDAFSSITGGYVVRDPRVPELAGRYVYGDIAQTRLWSGDAAGGGPRPEPGLPATNVVSFGEDGCGALLVVEIGGTVRRLEPDGGALPCPVPGAGGPGSGGGTGTATPLGAPGATVDRTAPLISLRVNRRPRLRSSVGLRLACSERCALTVTGRLRARGRSLSLVTERRELAARRRVSVRLRLGRRARAAARRALRQRGAAVITLRITARDAAGNRAARTVRVTLRR
jgi:hypothetical protein